MLGNFAQIYSPYLYQKKSGPRYFPAMIANSCFVLAAIGIATVLLFCLIKENKKLEAAENAIDAVTVEIEIDEKGEKKPAVTHTELSANDLDVLRLNPGFRYAL